MSRFRIAFGPEISARSKARISYAFRVFCAIYGHTIEPDNPGRSAACLYYGLADPPEAVPGAIHIPARYVERPTSEAAPQTEKFLYGGETFDLFFGVDQFGRADWLGEIFEWLSSADEISIVERDSVGRISFEKSIFARQGVSPLRAHAQLAMAWLEGYLTHGLDQKKLVRAPSPIEGIDHFVICSHDVDIHWTKSWTWRERVKRQVKNAAIGALESRSAPLLASSSWRVLKSAAGKRVDDFIPTLLKAAKQHGFRSTLFIIANSPHRRDANYRIEDLAPQLCEAAEAGFDIDLHGSYTSIVEKCDLRTEVEKLSVNVGHHPIGSRQHWLRFDHHHKLFSEIERARLAYDSTLGFSSEVGFRNGACFAFPPYDFKREAPCNFLEIPLAIMDRALVHANRNSDRSYAELTDAVLDESRRLGWGGIAMLWHNPVEDVYVPREVNQILWDRIRDKKSHREEWVSASGFLAASLSRYHKAGLLQNVELHAKSAHS